jgi:hypothetical protein
MGKVLALSPSISDMRPEPPTLGSFFFADIGGLAVDIGKI